MPFAKVIRNATHSVNTKIHISPTNYLAGFSIRVRTWFKTRMKICWLYFVFLMTVISASNTNSAPFVFLLTNTV